MTSLAVFSAEWFQEVERVLRYHVAQLSDPLPPFSIVERYVDDPQSGGQGFRLTFRGREIELERGAFLDNESDLVIETYREDAAKAALTKYGEVYDRITVQRRAAGRLSIKGKPPPALIANLLKSVHDDVVDFSAIS